MRPRGWAGAAGLVALVASLPFVRGLAGGGSFYFRDLAGQFLPLRRFVVEGLRSFELRYWNPYVHEGVPLAEPPISYPFDLLHLALPGNWGISLTLALHVPAAAAAFVLLCRSFGLAPPAALVGGIVYALGGFALSTLNLYIYVKALAWAPVVVMAMRGAAAGGRRALAGLALAAAVCASTTGVEILVQAVLIGLLLGVRPLEPRRLGRVALGLLLALALSAPTVLVLRDLATGSARAGGFPAAVTLAHSVHPLTWLQVVVADLDGDLDDIVGRWWGDNFFPQGFPYVLSLYLGAATLALAGVGALSGIGARGLSGAGPRRALFLLAALSAWVALGRYAGLTPIVEALPPLRMFRYPVKAFFTLHFVVALWAALGAQALLVDETRRTWRRLSALALAAAAPLLLCPALPALLPRATLWFAAGFFPPRLELAERYAALAAMAADAATGGALTAGVGALAWLVWRGRLGAGAGVASVAGLVAADLLRAGAGLNPTVTPRFFTTSPETTARARALRAVGARIFTCHVPESPSYLAVRARSGARHEFLTFALLRETLSPSTNVEHGVRSALSIDLTMLVPPGQVLEPAAASCRELDALLPRLRRAAVTHVLSLDPLSHAELELADAVSPPGAAPLRVFLYRLARALPFAALGADGDGSILALRRAPGRIDVEAEATRDTLLLVREGYARGWSARRDGRPLEVRRADDRHMAVALPPGHSRVELRYRPPSLPIGVFFGVLAALVVAALLVPGPRPA